MKTGEEMRIGRTHIVISFAFPTSSPLIFLVITADILSQTICRLRRDVIHYSFVWATFRLPDLALSQESWMKSL